MFTKTDADKMRNVRNYLADATWIESVALRMEGTFPPEKAVPKEWKAAMTDAEFHEMDLPAVPGKKVAKKKAK